MVPNDAGAAAAGADKPRLVFDHVGHAFDGVPVLKDISIAVAAAEVVCLLGPSGCGKTTLLRIAAGIERQTSGRVCVDGVEVSGPGVFLPPEKRSVGLVFQDYALFPHLTVRANVMFGLAHVPKAEARAEAEAAVARVGLARHIDDYPHALSGGEMQRVALARALVSRPAVLLMDEPFSGLDARLRDRVRDETITLLKEAQATAVVVTHDPEEAMRIGDRIALMRAGRLMQLGTPDDLYRRPVDLAAARFFSDLTEVPGRVVSGQAEGPLGRVPAPGLADGAAVIIAARPHALLLGSPETGVAGTVVRRRFLGEVDLVDVAVPGIDRPFGARVREIGRFRTGERVGVTLDPAATLVFVAN
ncbi:ABC transporter ATP-binding protein [Segnochrobactraceae bacterium EtOH-i3]